VSGPARPVDWGGGRYEVIAAGLGPAAVEVVEAAAPGPGERVVDVGCGSGSAALAAARRGARVVGVDPAPRLVRAAAGRAEELGLAAAFSVGAAEALPLADACADAVLSSFGVIFASDAATTAAELARVVAAPGRVAFSAWRPTGALYEMASLRRRFLAATDEGAGEHAGRRADERAGEGAGVARGPAPHPFAWHDGEAVEALFAPFGFGVELHDRRLAFTASSPAEFAERELLHHPLWLAAREVLAPRRAWDEVCRQVRGLFEHANEDPAGFRVTSSYVICILSRDGGAGRTGG